jgi:S1-C subfamily serine protease
MLIPLLVAALGIALGIGGIALLRPLNQASPPRLAATATAGDPRASAALSQTAIRARIEPSIVDVTAALTYDDETASGTGFVVDSASQFILTNNHVLRDATSVTVTVPATGQTYPARIVGVDVSADIAVLQIAPASPLPGAPLGDSSTVSVGMPVISFGNQAGAGGAPAVSTGVISGTNRTIQANDGASGFTETLHGMLATTARIEPGDSGGPLAGPAGTVIGVDTAAGTGSTATGYAIPISTALAAERQIAAGRQGEGITLGAEGFLGVITSASAARSPRAQQHGGTVTAAVVTAGALVDMPAPAGAAAKSTEAAVTPRSVTAACAASPDVSKAPAMAAHAAAGALVYGVLCGTGAAAAGISAGDVITVADGRHIVSPRALTALLRTCRPGTVISVTWISTTGASRTAPIRLTQAPAV